MNVDMKLYNGMPPNGTRCTMTGFTSLNFSRIKIPNTLKNVMRWKINLQSKTVGEKSTDRLNSVFFARIKLQLHLHRRFDQGQNPDLLLPDRGRQIQSLPMARYHRSGIQLS
jgi:hypothetical protein